MVALIIIGLLSLAVIPGAAMLSYWKFMATESRAFDMEYAELVRTNS